MDLQLGQYFLELDKYQDNVNYCKKNYVENSYNRYFVRMDTKYNVFLSVTA